MRSFLNDRDSLLSANHILTVEVITIITITTAHIVISRNFSIHYLILRFALRLTERSI